MSTKYLVNGKRYATESQALAAARDVYAKHGVVVGVEQVEVADSAHAAAAKLIRAELKARGFKGTVRSESYSGGTSINVRIAADLSPEQRKDFEAFANKFQYGHFDGSIDCYEYSNSRDDIPQVKFVFVEVAYSDEIKADVRNYIANIGGINEWERDRYEWQALSGSWGDFWTQRAARAAA